MLHGGGIYTNICPKNHPNVAEYTINWVYNYWLVVYLPLWKIWKSVMTILNIWTNQIHVPHHRYGIYMYLLLEGGGHRWLSWIQFYAFLTSRTWDRIPATMQRLAVQCAHLEKSWSSSMERMTSHPIYGQYIYMYKSCTKPPTRGINHH